jgi:hypothetical protein
MDNRVFEMQRLKFWQGQKLLSRDFRDQTSYEAQLRWWHNRALHNAYGVSYGFAVTLVDTRVRIDCGVAYDCYGRELILQAPRELALLDPTDDFKSMTLVATFDGGGRSISSKEILMGNVDCASSRIGPSIEWKPSADFQFVDGVPLAEISYEPSAQLASLPANVQIPAGLAQRVFYDGERKLLIAIGGLSTTPTNDEAPQLKSLSNDATYQAAIDKLVAKDERSAVLDAHFIVRRARGLTRPRLKSGATVPGDTAWELWTETIINPRGTKVEADLGIQVTIDTSGAGFTELPCYFAWVEGTLWNQVHLNFFPVPIIHIDRETTRRFRLRLWMPSIITVLGGRIRFANIDANLEQKGFPPPTPLLNTIVDRITGSSSGTSDGVAAAVAGTLPASIPTYNTDRSFVTDFVNFARQQKLYVCWLGIQEMVKPECQPFPACECITIPPEPPVQPVVKPKRKRRAKASSIAVTRDQILSFLKFEGKS